MIALHYIYIYIYILRRILTVKAATLWQSLEEVVSQAAREVGVLQLSCYTSFGLLNISITFSNAHLVLLSYIFRFPNGFKHVKMSGMPQHRQLFLLRVWGLHNSCTASNHHFPPQNRLLSLFWLKIGDQDKSWAPPICCKPCYNGLTAWFNGKKAAFNFSVPMVWREPRNHTDDCYFCLTNITGFNASSRKKIIYPNLRSAIRPVDLPVPTPPVNKDLLPSSDEEMPSREDSAESISLKDIESTYSGTSGNEPHWITQEDLNDLARGLYLSKQQPELLASQLKQWNLVQ